MLSTTSTWRKFSKNVRHSLSLLATKVMLTAIPADDTYLQQYLADREVITCILEPGEFKMRDGPAAAITHMR